MYRTYENPAVLQEQLDEALQELDEAIQSGNEDRIIYTQMDVECLRQQINIAWQDDEYDGSDY